MDSLRALAERLYRRGRLGAALAEYLGSRLDLLTPAQAAEMAEASMPFATAQSGDVGERFTQDFGIPIEDAFASFEGEPFEAGALFQWHRARLPGGVPVICKLRHPAFDAELAAARGRSASLEAGIEEVVGRWAEARGYRLERDFVRALEVALDLRREADDLVALSERFEESSLITTPEVHLDTTSERFLTLADLEGSTLAQAAARAPKEGPRLARRVCRAWLRAALIGARVPLGLAGRGTLLLPDGTVAFCRGPFQVLPGRVRARLERYLAATAIEDPQSLVDEVADLGAAESRHAASRLLHVLRHTAPFRDGEWEPESDRLASQVLAHWYRSREIGFRPRPEFLNFLRGLGMLTREAAAPAPATNSFAEAFQEVRLRELVLASARLSVGGAAMPLATLPRKLDRALRRAARHPEPSRPRDDRSPDSSESWGIVFALILALASVGLLVHYLAPLSGSQVWIEGAGFFAMLALGASLLRLA